MKFEKWLKKRLTEIIADLSLTDYKTEVYSEQDFVKPNLEYGVISVVVKHLTANKAYVATVEPLQIMVMAEENGLEAAQVIFTKLFQTYNWHQLKEGTTTYKMQFTSPVVLNNFNVVGAGYRSVLYVSATNYILENIADVDSLKIDDNAIDSITFQIAYGMSGDVKMFPSDKFAKTVRSTQTLSITTTVPCVSNALMTKITQVLHGDITGNTDFNLKFNFNSVAFNLTMKLSAAQFLTAPNETPSIQLGFTL